jgi:hypothetical protein
MKTPFRLQASNFDCVPTSFVNAIVYLFNRNEIPPLVLQRVYMLSLDCMFHNREHGEGTSDLAIRYIAQWLTEFKSNKFKSFRVEADYLEGDRLQLGPGNKLVECLNSNGVGVVSVRHFNNKWHEITLLKSEDRWLYAFDPYPYPEKKNRPGCYEFISNSDPMKPNLRIHYDWIDAASDAYAFRFGTKSNRAGVIIKRKI